jgi:hypothetical protein
MMAHHQKTYHFCTFLICLLKEVSSGYNTRMPHSTIDSENHSFTTLSHHPDLLTMELNAYKSTVSHDALHQKWSFQGLMAVNGILIAQQSSTV